MIISYSGMKLNGLQVRSLNPWFINKLIQARGLSPLLKDFQHQSQFVIADIDSNHILIFKNIPVSTID